MLFRSLHKWKNAEELVSKYDIYVYPRPYTSRPVSADLDLILSKSKIHRVKAPMIEISGTFIRNGIKKGKNMSYFLAPAVWKYISDMHFYEK